MLEKIHLIATQDTFVHMIGTNLYYEEVIDWKSCDYLWEVIPRISGVQTIPFLDTTQE